MWQLILMQSTLQDLQQFTNDTKRKDSYGELLLGNKTSRNKIIRLPDATMRVFVSQDDHQMMGESDSTEVIFPQYS